MNRESKMPQTKDGLQYMYCNYDNSDNSQLIKDGLQLIKEGLQLIKDCLQYIYWNYDNSDNSQLIQVLKIIQILSDHGHKVKDKDLPALVQMYFVIYFQVDSVMNVSGGESSGAEVGWLWRSI